MLVRYSMTDRLAYQQAYAVRTNSCRVLAIIEATGITRVRELIASIMCIDISRVSFEINATSAIIYIDGIPLAPVKLAVLVRKLGALV